jgi:hypothetical protein
MPQVFPNMQKYIDTSELNPDLSNTCVRMILRISVRNLNRILSCAGIHYRNTQNLKGPMRNLV